MRKVDDGGRSLVSDRRPARAFGERPGLADARGARELQRRGLGLVRAGLVGGNSAAPSRRRAGAGRCRSPIPPAEPIGGATCLAGNRIAWRGERAREASIMRAHAVDAPAHGRAALRSGEAARGPAQGHGSRVRDSSARVAMPARSPPSRRRSPRGWRPHAAGSRRASRRPLAPPPRWHRSRAVGGRARWRAGLIATVSAPRSVATRGCETVSGRRRADRSRCGEDGSAGFAVRRTTSWAGPGTIRGAARAERASARSRQGGVGAPAPS